MNDLPQAGDLAAANLPTDAELLAAVGLMVGHDDPVPAAMVEAAMAAFTWRTVDAELFDLLFDSALEGQLATVRAVDQPARMLTLASTAYTLEVEVEAAPGGGAPRASIVRGMVSPANGATIELEGDGIHLDAPVSPEGLFEFHLDAPAPFRLAIIDTSTGVRTVTPWIDR